MLRAPIWCSPCYWPSLRRSPIRRGCRSQAKWRGSNPERSQRISSITLISDFEGARYGLDALKRLKTSAEGKDAAVIRASAERALGTSYSGEDVAAATTPARRAINIAVHASGRTLPASFLDQNWAVVGNERWPLPRCLTRFDAQCEAVLLDLNGDGHDEVALLDFGQ